MAGVEISSASIVQDFTLLSDVINSASYGQIVAEEVKEWGAEVLQEDNKTQTTCDCLQGQDSGTGGHA